MLFESLELRRLLSGQPVNAAAGLLADTSQLAAATYGLSGGTANLKFDALGRVSLSATSSAPAPLSLDGSPVTRPGERGAGGQGADPSATWSTLPTPSVVEINGKDLINDTLQLDLSIVPPSLRTIIYNGGAGGYDVLKVNGGKFQSEVYTPTGKDSGTITYSPLPPGEGQGEGAASGLTVVYTGLEPVVDNSTVEDFTVEGTEGDDNITVAEAGQDENDQQNMIVSEANDNFENVTFTNKTNVTVAGLGGNDTIQVPAGHPSDGLASLTLDGGEGDDTLHTTWLGGGIEYTLIGGNGNDTYVMANAFNEIGNLTIVEDDSRDSDTLDFSGLSSAVTVDLGSTDLQTNDYGTFTLSSDTGIENVIGSTTAANTLSGNSRDNTLIGGPGDDTLSGGAGFDTLDGGDGDNTLDYGSPPQFVGSTTSFAVNEDASPTYINLVSDFQDESTASQNLQFEWVDQDGDDLFSSIDISNGTLTAGYAPDAFGQSDITIRVTNSEGQSTEQTYSFTVDPVNDGPTTTGLSDITVDQGSPRFGVPTWLAFNNVEDGQNLSFSYSVNDTAGIISEIDMSGGLLSITPSNVNHGSTEITITGTDSDGASVQAGFDFTVDAPPINHAPVLDYLPQFNESVPAAITGQSSGGMILVDLNNSGGSVTATFTVDASDQDTGDALAFALVSGPASVEQTDATHANVTFSVDESDVQTTVPITVRVTDDGNPALSDEETYLVNVIDSSIDPYGPPALGDGGAKFVYTVPIDGVLQTYSNGLPAALPAGYYEPGSPDGRGNQVIISSYTEPSHGTLDLNVDDGTFTYTADEGYYGDDAFTFQTTDGVGYSNFATVTLKRDGLVANDDEATVDGPGIPIEIPVLQNDHAGGNGPLKIVSVSPTDQGGEVWIAPGGQSLFYLPPDNIQSDEWGGPLPVDEDIPESTDAPEDVPGPGGVQRFFDRFEYTVENDNGEEASAFVQVRTSKDPEWKLSLVAKYNKQENVKIDGTPGYELKIHQDLGKDPLALINQGFTQTWQTNTQSGLNMGLDDTGTLRLSPTKNEILLDTANVNTFVNQIVHIDDLGIKLPAYQQTLLLMQEVSKKLGFNAPDKKLRVPVVQPWKPNAQEKALLPDMQGPFLEATTSYIFVDKDAIMKLNAKGIISNQALDAIKAALQSKGVNFNQLQKTFERYQISGPGLNETWTYP